jgi:hypothetical protein
MPSRLIIPQGLLPAAMTAALLPATRLPPVVAAARHDWVSPTRDDAYPAHTLTLLWRWLMQTYAPATPIQAPGPALWPWLEPGRQLAWRQTSPHIPGPEDPLPEGVVWVAMADPVHLAVTGEGLVLTPLAPATLDSDDAQRLWQVANDCLAHPDGPARQRGLTMQIVRRAGQWFWCADRPMTLHTPALEHLTLAPVRANAFQGADAATLSIIVNDLQMHWHAHCLNADRETRGLLGVNGLWLHGSGTLSSDPRASREPARAALMADPATGWLMTPTQAAQAQDWSAWVRHIEHLLQDLATQPRDDRTVILVGNDRIRQLSWPRQDRWRHGLRRLLPIGFRPSAADLFSE